MKLKWLHKKNTGWESGHSSTKRLFGADLSFSATEAYKLLRANLAFCLRPEEEERSKCIVVGLTSSVQGEGKSTTSINLAYVLAEDGKKVCLLEGDMRAPMFKSRLKLTRNGGLSNTIVGTKQLQEVINVGVLHKNLSVVSAGDIPPNPAELLGSKRMAHLIELLKTVFDYVIIDLPPVTVVSDALTVSGVLDGMLFIVEEGLTTKRDLNDAMQRLEVIKDKILGFVITHAEVYSGRYSKKGDYGYGYGEKKGKHAMKTLQQSADLSN